MHSEKIVSKTKQNPPHHRFRRIAFSYSFCIHRASRIHQDKNPNQSLQFCDGPSYLAFHLFVPSNSCLLLSLDLLIWGSCFFWAGVKWSLMFSVPSKQCGNDRILVFKKDRERNARHHSSRPGEAPQKENWA